MYEPPFYFWVSDGEGWIRVIGAGSIQNATLFKERTRSMIRSGVHRFAVDLAECPLIDSTFTGMLASLALRLREMERGRVRILNANADCKSFLRNLGLDTLFDLED